MIVALYNHGVTSAVTASAAGSEITQEPHTYTFRSRTYEGAVNNWEIPLFVVFHSGDGLPSPLAAKKDL